MATHQNEPLVVERKETIMVKPSQPTPSDLLSLSTIDNDPNLDLLCQTIYVYRSLNNVCDPNQLDPAPVIRQGLSKALVHYYPLAGKLIRHEDGKLRANCTGEGVPLCSATANCTLSSLNYLDDVSVENAKLFVLDLESLSKLGLHPLVLQITRFACGGFTVGMGLSHSICDGFGSAQFFKAIAELASGAHEPSVKPVWGRERLVGSPSHESIIKFPIDKASFSASPYLPSTNLVHESFNVTAESIRRLRARLEKDHEGVTTLEALGAYVWRSKFKALEMNLDGKTNFSLAIGIRNMLDPPLPEGYYGNAFIGSHVVLEGKELCEWPLSKVAWMINESKRRAKRIGYVEDYLGMLEEINRENRRVEASGSTTIVTDWRHMGLMEVDFGWERSVNIVPVPWKMFGYIDLCIFLPPFGLDPAMKGGVRVLVCLPRAAIGKFKEEMASLSNETLSE